MTARGEARRRPSAGSTSPASAPSSVDLPLPFGPLISTRSPCATAKSSGPSDHSPRCRTTPSSATIQVLRRSAGVSRRLRAGRSHGASGTSMRPARPADLARACGHSLGAHLHPLAGLFVVVLNAAAGMFDARRRTSACLPLGRDQLIAGARGRAPARYAPPASRSRWKASQPPRYCVACPESRSAR